MGGQGHGDAGLEETTRIRRGLLPGHQVTQSSAIRFRYAGDLGRLRVIQGHDDRPAGRDDLIQPAKLQPATEHGHVEVEFRPDPMGAKQVEFVADIKEYGLLTQDDFAHRIQSVGAKGRFIAFGMLSPHGT